MPFGSLLFFNVRKCISFSFKVWIKSIFPQFPITRKKVYWSVYKALQKASFAWLWGKTCMTEKSLKKIRGNYELGIGNSWCKRTNTRMYLAFSRHRKRGASTWDEVRDVAEARSQNVLKAYCKESSFCSQCTVQPLEDFKAGNEKI